MNMNDFNTYDSIGRINNKILPVRDCIVCGAKYKPRNYTAKYCSRKCLWSRPIIKEKKNEYWWVNDKGYIEGMVLNAEGKQCRVKQHRYVMEQHIGRKLLPTEDVHHINGIKTDNRIENLQVLPHGKHSSITNNSREYKKGYKMKLSNEERKRRAESMRKNRRITKALTVK